METTGDNLEENLVDPADSWDLPEPQVESTALSALTKDKPPETVALLNYEAVKAFIKDAYEKGGTTAAKKAMLLVPSGWMQKLMTESFKGNPCVNMQAMSIDVDGLEIPLCYWTFETAGRIDEFRQWREDALTEYLSDFENVKKFIAHPKFGPFGGWEKIRNWWPEIIERAFRKNPSPSLSTLVYNLYVYTARVKAKDQTAMAEIQTIHAKIVKEYIEESYENTKKIIFHPNFQPLGGWKIIPEKWILEFCLEAFGAHPFGQVGNSVLEHNGVTRKVPVFFYHRHGRLGELTRLRREVTSKSLNTLDKVLELTTHSGFHVLGGWKLVPERWRKVLIVRAVMQSKLDRPSPKNLKCRKGQQEQCLQALYQFYKAEGIVDTFMAYYEIGIRERDKEKAHRDELSETATTTDRPAATTARKYLPEEEVKRLLKLAKEGDLKARDRAIENYENFLWYISLKFSNSNPSMARDLFQEAVLVAYDCIRTFEVERDVKFMTYIHDAIKRELVVARAVMQSGRARSEIRTSIARYSEFKKNYGIDLNQLSPAEIAEISGWTLRKAANITDAFRPNMSRLEAPLAKDPQGDLTVGSSVADENSTDAERSAMAKNLHEVINLLLGWLSLRDRIIFKQYYGIANGARITPYQLREASKRKDIFELTLKAAEKLRLAVIEFCKNPSVTCDGVTTNKLLAVATASVDPQETIDGENALGVLLKGEIQSEIQMVFINALNNSLTMEESIMLTEIFNIPRREDVKPEHLGNTLGISRQWIWKIVQTRMPLLKKIARSQLNLDLESMILTSEDDPHSNWDYAL